QRRTVVLWIHGGKCAGEAVTERTGLAAGATAVQACEDVVGALKTQSGQGLLDELLVHLVREVLLKRLAVDLPLTGARDDTDARDSGLPAARSQRGADRRRDVCLADRLGSLGGVLGRVLFGVLVVFLNVFDAGGRAHGSSLTSLVSRRLRGLLDLGDLVRHRLLGLVRVLRPGVHLELLRHPTAERVLRQHALDRLLYSACRVLRHQFAVGNGTQAAGVAGVTV